MGTYYAINSSGALCHYGVKGMHWGVRRYQNLDGSLTAQGKKHVKYANLSDNTINKVKQDIYKSKAVRKENRNERIGESLATGALTGYILGAFSLTPAGAASVAGATLGQAAATAVAQKTRVNRALKNLNKMPMSVAEEWVKDLDKNLNGDISNYSKRDQKVIRSKGAMDAKALGTGIVNRDGSLTVRSNASDYFRRKKLNKRYSEIGY